MGQGAVLARELYDSEVRPALEAIFPGLGHVAARLGSGSEVLGLDDERSTDHDFGCRLTILVDDAASTMVPEIDRVLQARLPDALRGWPSAVAAETWEERQDHLGLAIEELAHRQHEVGLPITDPPVHQFFERPFLVASAEVAGSLTSEIRDPDVRALPPIGCIEQWSDNVDLLTSTTGRVKAAGMYELR